MCIKADFVFSIRELQDLRLVEILLNLLFVPFHNFMVENDAVRKSIVVNYVIFRHCLILTTIVRIYDVYLACDSQEGVTRSQQNLLYGASADIADWESIIRVTQNRNHHAKKSILRHVLLMCLGNAHTKLAVDFEALEEFKFDVTFTDCLG